MIGTTTRAENETAGSMCCRPFLRALQFRWSLPASATSGAASAVETAATVEAASATEATTTANGRVTAEAAANRPAPNRAATEAACGTASREPSASSEPSAAAVAISAPAIAIATPTEGPIAATTVEAAVPIEASVKPRASADKDATGKPIRAVVAVRRARVRIVSIVTVLADGSFTDIAGIARPDSNADRNSLCTRERR